MYFHLLPIMRKSLWNTWIRFSGANFAQGSFWNAFNTVTYMTDHIQGRSNDGRMTSSWYGRNRRVKLKALDTALEMASIA